VLLLLRTQVSAAKGEESATYGRPPVCVHCILDWAAGWDGLFSYCFTFREYFEFPLGSHLFLFILCYRLLILYRLLVLQRPSSGLYRLAVVLAVYVPLLTVYVLLDLTGNSYRFDMSHGLGCIPKLAWSIYGFSMIFLGLAALLYLNYSLKDTPASVAAFHEYSETKQGSIVFLVFYTVVSTLYFTGASLHFWGQAIILSVVYIVVNYYFWMVLFDPLTGCLFHHEETLHKFYEQIGRLTGEKSASTQRTGGGNRHSAPLSHHRRMRYSQETLARPSADAPRGF